MILISACLCGINCKYNGNNNYCQKVVDLKEKYNLTEEQKEFAVDEAMNKIGTTRWHKNSEEFSDKFVIKSATVDTRGLNFGVPEMIEYFKAFPNCLTASKTRFLSFLSSSEEYFKALIEISQNQYIPKADKFLNGDDLSENVYRASKRLPMRFGHVNISINNFCILMHPHRFKLAHRVAFYCYYEITGNILEDWNYAIGEAISR